MNNIVEQPKGKLVSVIDLASREDCPLSEHSLRWHLFNRQQNGLNKSVVKVGGRIFIDTVKFQDWLRSSPQSDQPSEVGV
jgi:hypothetical protein